MSVVVMTVNRLRPSCPPCPRCTAPPLRCRPSGTTTFSCRIRALPPLRRHNRSDQPAHDLAGDMAPHKPTKLDPDDDHHDHSRALGRATIPCPPSPHFPRSSPSRRLPLLPRRPLPRRPCRPRTPLRQKRQQRQKRRKRPKRRMTWSQAPTTNQATKRRRSGPPRSAHNHHFTRA
jgi:hypothetical protein